MDDIAKKATLIDGKRFSEQLRERVADEVGRLATRGDVVPGLAVVLVGDDPASRVYVQSKQRAVTAAGMRSFEHSLAAETTQQRLLDLIHQLNADADVHGILVQLPLPDHIDPGVIIEAIDPRKDVDGFHPTNVGRLGTGQGALVPCTPLGCLMLLQAHLGSLAGREAVVVGRSNIVGKPMAALLLGHDCTVTMAHSRTRNLPDVVGRADIVVAAAGRAHLIQGDWLKPGAVVIDVGINRIAAPERGEGKMRLVGDVDFDGAFATAGAITPVPGGVGPMTIACLLVNTLTAACRIHQLDEPEGLAPSL
ncbi:bifunctional methylenetetrahydrofolate dehydrogenase/methenyltetrahydrofolate cyclohydrolase FolD [Notoacmeibacter sp. MSK16QG-6]|uniref:bifunctional methylenetetrahydrofolate dehydrogenase/methenyltetrahydrofolate cyclohydrolase FolD n=1 Tax=Notoacmeibacter sp. MSK16QG-6 TaxID=2957982 RepID=UPI00209F9740|nr:bifunctional methylenetetrahydrofolate dehydrogenase/methenyltetrahydrofolate cyclohydrolase FolD [Notoacmeibacter sp. MSK16QG-6]MCP1199500.1 bifunctional methylenetetrahydrofolate dehydrogenase/methenyltetrahydrofolate cyclohydrolase FolD [Notoacmeibacter sp. MSK16QG-6]